MIKTKRESYDVTVCKCPRLFPAQPVSVEISVFFLEGGIYLL